MAPSSEQSPARTTQQHAGDVHAPRPVTQERPKVESSPVAPAAAPAPAAPAAQASGEMVLPLTVVSRADISRSLREVETLIDYFHQAAIRGSKAESLPAVGRVLDGVAKANNLNLLHTEDRVKIKEFLTHVKAKAPVVHMSFPSEASASFLAKILEWFRTEAHPLTVLHIGLQPELAAGCLVRTNNKSFDFSFRRRFEQSKKKLVTALEQASKDIAAAPAPAVAAPQAAQAPPQAAEASTPVLVTEVTPQAQPAEASEVKS